MRETLLLSALLLASVAMIPSGCGGEETRTEPFPVRQDLFFSDSIGVELGDSAYVFGFVIDASFGPSGEILVLDQASAELRAFSRDGRFIGFVARRGEGPGELGMPMSIAILGDSLIMVMEPMKGGHIVYDDDYSLVEEHALWVQNPPLNMRGLDGEDYAAFKLEVEIEDGRIFMNRLVSRFELGEREPSVTYTSDRKELDPTDFTSIVTDVFYYVSIAGTPDGRVFVAPFSTGEYVVRAFSGDGEPVYTIEQRVPRVAKDELEIEDEAIFYESYARRIGAQGVELEWEPDPYRWMIASIGVDRYDRLWVVRGTERSPVFDVYDAGSGDHLFSAQLREARGRSWMVRCDRAGMLAWEEDPGSGYQKVYVIEYPEP